MKLLEYSRKSSATLLCLCLTGIGSLLYSVTSIWQEGMNHVEMVNSLVMVVLLASIFQKSVRLPSGSVWRPAIGIIMYCAFIHPLSISIFVVFLGMYISKLRMKTNWLELFLSLGHVSIGIVPFKLIMLPYKQIAFDLPDGFYWVLAGLVAHFVTNRLISAIIISSKKGVPFFRQIKKIKYDLNWGYLSTYLISMSMVFMHHAYGTWGMLVMVLLLYSIYYSVFYFRKASDLEKMYLKDSLTGSENRASWEIFKIKYKASGEAGTLAIIDLDNFKGINDKWGHDIGDKILCETAACLKDIYQEKSRVFRFGGDEFLLFIPHFKNEEEVVQQLIEKRIYQKNKEWLGRNFKVGMSKGMEFIPQSTQSLEEVFTRIDKEMYKNKKKSLRNIN